jgi:uncharacterized repeat protein (TIGR01451 family)
VTTSVSADLEASKSFSPAAPVAGLEFTYTIGVENLGPSDAKGVELNDPLPPQTSFVSAPGCTETSGTVNCEVGDLAVGDSREFVVTVSLAPDATAVSNTVTVSGTTPDPNPGNDTATAEFDAGASADVSITKVASPGTINQGETSVFTLEVKNLGPSVAENVVVNDPLPAGLIYVSDDSGCAELSNTITCDLGNFVPGQNQTIRITVQGRDVGEWLNEATVTSDTDDPDPGNNTGSDNLTVDPTADLAILKTAPAMVRADAQFTYSMEVENKGPSPATGVVIDDPLPAGLAFVSSADCTSAMVCAIGDLAVDEIRTVTAVVQVTPAVAGSTVINTATVSGNEFDPDTSNNEDSAQTAVRPLADVVVTKTGPATVRADSRIRWNIQVGNLGPNAAENVVLDDTLPPEVTDPTVTTTQGICDRTVACRFGTVPVGATVTVTVEATVPRGTAPGTVLLNEVRVATTTDELDPGGFSNWETTVTPPTPFPADLRIFKQRVGAPAPVTVGDVVSFRLTATNDGEATARNVVIRDKLSPKLRYIDSSIPGGRCSEQNATVTCRVSQLAGGQSVSARIRVRTIATGQIVNTARISGDNATISVPSWTVRFPVRGGNAEIAVSKRADRVRTVAGGTVGYRVEVRNTSSQAAVDVVVCDRIPGGTTVVRTGGGRLDAGRICWDIPFFAGQARRAYRVKLRVDRFFNFNTLTNVATAAAGNVRGVRRDSAKVNVIRIGNTAKGGGVTG